jgi:hypothetical protein
LTDPACYLRSVILCVFLNPASSPEQLRAAFNGYLTGLQTRIATTESVWLCTRMKS